MLAPLQLCSSMQSFHLRAWQAGLFFFPPHVCFTQFQSNGKKEDIFSSMMNNNPTLQQLSSPMNRALFKNNEYNSWYGKTVHNGGLRKGERMEVQLPHLPLKKGAKGVKMKQKGPTSLKVSLNFATEAQIN